MSETEARRPDNPGVIAPPPLIYALPLIAGVIVHYAVGGMDMGLPGVVRWPLGLLLILGGLLVIGLAIERFTRAKTNPEPWKPTTAIVAEGIYSLTRNPMYLGMAAAYAGIAILWDCWFTLALLVPALIVIDRGVIVREERYLERKFGGEYVVLKRRTRRWI
jgi:protein-S-isoprenylcysteine O-methyltransferase Ste14